MPATINDNEHMVIRQNGMIMVIDSRQYMKWNEPNTIYDGPMSLDDAEAWATLLNDTLVNGVYTAPWW